MQCGVTMEEDDKKCKSRKCFIYVLSCTTILIGFGVLMAFQYKQQQELYDELSVVKTEVELIKLQLQSLSSLERFRRDADPKSDPDADPDAADGGVPIVYDYAYGIDLATKSSLSVYPSLQGDLKSKQSSSRFQGSSSYSTDTSSSSSDASRGAGGGNGVGGGRSNNNYNYHYLGIMRQVSQEDSPPPAPIVRTTTASPKNASAYGKRLNTFRHSRVSLTAKQESSERQPVQQIQPQVVIEDHKEQQLQYHSASQEHVKHFKKPTLKSLDSDSGDNNDLVSIHLQAKVSVGDESSSHLSTGLHDAWRLSRWSEKLKGAKLFKLDENSGQISVPQNGLYLVYAQVEYLDNHDVNGYEVYLNNEPIISCVTSTHAPKERKKHNTCYTSAVVFIQEGGLLHVRDKEAGRYSLLHSTGTFFGVTKI